MNETTAIVPVRQRAIQALGYPDLAKTVTELKALAAKSADITSITNQAGYGQVHTARMVLKKQRIDIEKTGKAARDDANAFNKAVIEIEKQLIAVIAPEEERLAALNGEWDAARERERQAEIDAENARIARIQTAIDEIRALPMEASGKTSAHALSVLAEAQALVLTEDEYQEHLQTAQSALFVAITAIKGVVFERQTAEAEAERIRLERIELARHRAEQEARERAERERVAAELATARAETERLQRAAKEAQAAADAAQAEAHRQTAELERQRREADEKRLAEDIRVSELQEAESQRLADERAELERRERELETVKAPALDVRDVSLLGFPRPADILALLCDEFEMSQEDMIDLLLSINWSHYKAQLKTA